MIRVKLLKVHHIQLPRSLKKPIQFDNKQQIHTFLPLNVVSKVDWYSIIAPFPFNRKGWLRGQVYIIFFFQFSENDFTTPQYIKRLLQHPRIINPSSLIPPKKFEIDDKTFSSHYEFDTVRQPYFGKFSFLWTWDEIYWLLF